MQRRATDQRAKDDGLPVDDGRQAQRRAHGRQAGHERPGVDLRADRQEAGNDFSGNAAHSTCQRIAETGGGKARFDAGLGRQRVSTRQRHGTHRSLCFSRTW
jgi:hypothetical protein